MILGAIVGDIVGCPFEFNNLKSTEFPLYCERSSFTDDTVMTLAVAEALMRAFDGGEPLSYALTDSLLRFGRAYPDAGYGARFHRWLAGAESIPQPYDSWGNGSAMRVSPAAWACRSLEAVEVLAAETAKVTHNHPEGIRGAQATAACIYLARAECDDAEIRSYVEDRFGYSLDFRLDEIRDAYEFDESCQGTVPQAIEVFFEARDFEDCARLAVSFGGDSDTLAAIACSIAHARWGVPDLIEQEARARLTEDLIAVNDAFCERFGVA